MWNLSGTAGQSASTIAGDHAHDSLLAKYRHLSRRFSLVKVSAEKKYFRLTFVGRFRADDPEVKYREGRLSVASCQPGGITSGWPVTRAQSPGGRSIPRTLHSLVL